jgi:hypothetical protein
MSVAQAMLQLLLHAATNVLLRRGHLQHAGIPKPHPEASHAVALFRLHGATASRRSVHPSILDIRA